MNLEEKYHKVRDALVQLVGSDDEEELENMLIVIGVTPAPQEQKLAVKNAIQVILETRETT